MIWYTVLAFIIAYMVWKRITRKDALDGIPGPKGLPLLGNALQIDKEKAHQSVTELAGSYGDVFKINMLGLPIVVVSGQAQLHEMLVKKGNDFAGRMRNFLTEFLSFSYGSVGSNDPRHPGWHDMKKLLFSHIKGYGSGMKRIEAITIEAINEALEEMASHQSSVDPQEIMKTVLINITYILALGKKFENDEQRNEIIDIGELFIRTVKPGLGSFWLMKFPWLRFMGHPTYKGLCEFRDRETDLFNKWKELSLEDKDDKLKFINRMYDLQDSLAPGMVTENHVLANTWLLFHAGNLTTSGTLASLFHILADNPHIQQQLHQEIDTIAGRDACIEDRNTMPYHQACIYETLRLVPIVPLLMAHTALKDSTIGEYNIPKGTTIWPNVWALQHNENIFDAPYEFRPERFLDADGQLVAADHPSRKNIMTFGAGPRVCGGETFAMTRMFLILAQMMKNFEILPDSEGQEPFDCRKMVNGMALMPKKFKLSLKRRN